MTTYLYAKESYIFLYLVPFFSLSEILIAESKMSGGEAGRLGNIMTNPEGEFVGLPAPATAPGPATPVMTPHGGQRRPNLLQRPCMYLAW